MRIGERWTNAYGEQVTVNARGGLSVAGVAQNRAPTRTIEEAPFMEPVPYFDVDPRETPRTPRIAHVAVHDGGGEAQFLPPSKYWERK